MSFIKRLLNFDAENGWTGGQYSIFRAIFGIYLLVHFLNLIPWGAEMWSNQGVLPNGSNSPLLYLFPNVLALSDASGFVTALMCIASALSIMLIIGWRDRLAAFGLWYLWACLLGRNPLISNPGIPYVGLVLLVMSLFPPAPYGSLARRGDIDPGTNWRLPQPLFVVVWILMALGYTYSGYTKLISPSWVDGTAIEHVLNNPLARPGFVRDVMLSLPPICLKLATWGTLAAEILFLPLALMNRIRPYVWAMLLSMHIGLMTMINFVDLSMGMVMLQLFTFNPAWIKPKQGGVERVFYDGACGLCHRAVRFLLAEDRAGSAFKFAPLGGFTFEETVPSSQRNGLPDSLVVATSDNRLLVKSDAWLHILARLGGAWRLLSIAFGFAPKAMLDYAYDFVAGIRYKVFEKQVNACPMLPKELRKRFEA